MENVDAVFADRHLNSLVNRSDDTGVAIDDSVLSKEHEFAWSRRGNTWFYHWVILVVKVN